MRDPDKKLQLNTKISVKVEEYVSECLDIMEKHSEITRDELVNTALRRFIATHKDYFPEGSTALLKRRLE